MTAPSGGTSPARLNYGRIRERATELGVAYDTVCASAGLRRHSEHDPDQRTVTLAVLRVTFALRAGALPARVNDQFLSEKTRRAPLTAPLAVDLLRLVRRRILEPFPGDPLSVRAEPSAHRDERTLQLLSRRIATGTGTRTGDEVPLYIDDLGDSTTMSNETVAGLRIHPDVMFALCLAEEPAPPNPL
jgi:hypothetical protein